MFKRMFFAVLTLAFVFSLTACSQQADSIADALREVRTVRLTWQGETRERSDADWIGGLREQIGDVEISREEMVNDGPSADEYVTVDFVFEEDELRAYLYEEEGVWYLEFPYQGICELEEPVADYFMKMFDDAAPAE